MPHIHLETTADLPENADVPDILRALCEALAEQGSVHPGSIRAFHSLRSVWQMGEGGPAGFAHVTVSVLSGAALDWKLTMAQALMAVLTKHFAGSLEGEEASVTLEVREIEEGSYQTALAGD